MLFHRLVASISQSAGVWRAGLNRIPETSRQQRRPGKMLA